MIMEEENRIRMKYAGLYFASGNSLREQTAKPHLVALLTPVLIQSAK